MKTRSHYVCKSRLLAVLALGWLYVSMTLAADRPNILYIMSDDHAAHAISAYGGRLAEIAPTPNIDRLAAEGALFTNAFCTNSICSPSRACVLTGQYDHVNGAFDLAGSVSPGKQMLAIQMKQAGYQTAMIGKWHLNPHYSPSVWGSVVLVGGSVLSVAVGDFSVDCGCVRTTAPSPNPTFVSMGAVTDEALLASGRAPVEA